MLHLSNIVIHEPPSMVLTLSTVEEALFSLPTSKHGLKHAMSEITHLLNIIMF